MNNFSRKSDRVTRLQDRTEEQKIELFLKTLSKEEREMYESLDSHVLPKKQSTVKTAKNKPKAKR